MRSELLSEIQIYSVIQKKNQGTDFFFHKPNDIAVQLGKKSMKEGRIMTSLGHSQLAS